MKTKKYKIVIEIELSEEIDHPALWNWEALLDLQPEERILRLEAEEK